MDAYSTVFLALLPKRSLPELRDLRFDSIAHIFSTGKRQRKKGKKNRINPSFLGDKPIFPKLEKISFAYIRHFKDLNNDAIANILQWNPQLKSLNIDDCAYIDDNIFQAIATLTPHLETLSYMNNPYSFHCGNGEYLCQRPNLKATLKLKVVDSTLFRMREIRDLFFERLQLDFGCNFLSVADFVKSLSKSKQLRQLRINVSILKAFSDVLEIGHHCDELNELHIEAFKMKDFSMHQLLQLIQNANKLETLYLDDFSGNYCICINDEVYMKMVRIVNNRPQKTHLKIVLRSKSVYNTVSQDLMKIHSDSLTMATTIIYGLLWN